MRDIFRSLLFCFLACLTVIVSAAIDISKARALRDVNRYTRGWRDIEMTTERVLGALRDAETGQRGYLLTQQPEYLAPFEKGSAEVLGLINELESLTKNRPEQLERTRQIGTLAKLKLEELQATIALNRSGDPAAALALVKTHQGQMLMDQIRSLVADIGTAAAGGIRENRARADSATRDLIASVVVTSLVSISVLIVLTYLLRRDGRHIRDAAEQLAITLRSIGDAVVTTDAAGHVTFLNEVAAKIGQKSLPQEPTLFRDLFKLVNEVTGEEAKDPITQALEDGKTIGLANHTALLRPDGSRVSIEDSAAPLRDEDGAIRGVVFVFKDISERRQVENDLAGARAQLETSVMDLKASEEQLRAADRRKDEFLATLAHELRNPIAPIRHAIQILDNEKLDEEQHRWARAVITRQARHVSRLLDDLLDSARITQGELTLQVAPVLLSSVVTEALDVVTPLIERKNHSIELKLPDRPLVLRVDGVRLAQVLSNLLTNAAKYTDEGGRIVLTVELTPEQLLISIKDSGVGLTAEAIPHVFKMFSQIPSTLNRSEGGLGIGLSLSNELIRLHGGRIDVRSDGAGLGSEFVVRLPAVVVDSGVSATGRPPVKSDFVHASRVLLIIDDNVDAAASLGMLLEISGNDVLLAHSGEDGLKVAREHHPEAVIIDIGLPGMNGYEVAQALRAEPEGRDILLIALSGWGQTEDKERAVSSGFNHHVTKPADPDEVEQLIFGHSPA